MNKDGSECATVMWRHRSFCPCAHRPRPHLLQVCKFAYNFDLFYFKLSSLLDLLFLFLFFPQTHIPSLASWFHHWSQLAWCMMLLRICDRFQEENFWKSAQILGIRSNLNLAYFLFFFLVCQEPQEGDSAGARGHISKKMFRIIWQLGCQEVPVVSHIWKI